MYMYVCRSSKLRRLTRVVSGSSTIARPDSEMGFDCGFYYALFMASDTRLVHCEAGVLVSQCNVVNQ